MYLKSLKITNFRKFGNENNLVEFVGSNDISTQKKNINIAPSTTLIVGKNNSGKTTVNEALKKLILSNNKFCASDYNFIYLSNLLEEYSNDKFDSFPYLEFQITVGINFKSDCDLVTNFVSFMNLQSVENEDGENHFTVLLRHEIKETTTFVEAVKTLISQYKGKAILFRKFLGIIDSAERVLNCYDPKDLTIVENSFRLKDLLEIKVINANKVIDDKSLSDTFNRIIKLRYKAEKKQGIQIKVAGEIDKINDAITEKITESHTTSINTALSKIESSDRLKVNLSADLTFDRIFDQIIRYEYTEGKFHIPEGQFGLGYSNLMTIIGELIEYIEKYPKQDCHSKINLICIEEPEAFMHSQMQELFITHINDAIKYLLDDKQIRINSQLIITTHSSHILNSKIHSGKSFNNISYINIVDNFSHVVNLNDDNVIGGDAEKNGKSIDSKKDKANDKKEEEKNTEQVEKRDALDDLKFLKKHIKYKVSELFFSDAVIFVEGVTEATLLSYYLDKDDDLNKYYISIFNINGAHALVYYHLIKLLKVPTLIITDIDIQRKDEEKYAVNEDGKKIDIFTQIQSIDGRVSTNATIHRFNGKETAGLSKYLIDGNLYGVFQKDAINEFYATSFEEAFILTNYNNNMLQEVLKSLKPQIYKDILGENEEEVNLKSNSYKLQKKLSDCKSDFANQLLYEVIVNKGKKTIPALPKYIDDGLKWLTKAVKKQVKGVI